MLPPSLHKKDYILGRPFEHTISTLTPIPPYDFDLTAAYATYFQGHYGAEWYHDGVFRRLLDLGDRVCLVEMRSLGSVDSPSLEMELKCPSPNDAVVSAVLSQVSRLLGIDQELAPFYQMALKDPALTSIAQGLWGLHIPQTTSVWEALVLAILGQQVSAHMARILRTLLVQTYGHSIKDSGSTYHTFPSPEILMEAGTKGLQSIKLSSKKAKYIIDIASMVASRELNLERLRALSDEEVIRTITSIHGVGPWTAQWLLIRGLCRPDAFPHEDLALRRAIVNLLKDANLFRPKETLKHSRQWSPFRSYVTTYIFAAMRSGRFPDLSRKSNIGKYF